MTLFFDCETKEPKKTKPKEERKNLTNSFATSSKPEKKPITTKTNKKK